MNLLIVLGALVFLMFVAYRGYSVILFAPVAALGAVLLTDPSLVPPMFSSVFMEKMVGFVKSYFPVFLLGAVFGKVIELSGFSKSIVSAVIGVLMLMGIVAKNSILLVDYVIIAEQEGMKRFDAIMAINFASNFHAIKAALAKVETEILKTHAACCVEEAIAAGDADAQRRKFSELVEVFAKAKL